jgi:hypothetical protein
MILATSPQPDKTDPIATLAPDLRDFARQAAHNGTTLDTFERGLLKRLLAMGRTTTDLFLNAQGHGDLGPTVETAERTILHRSERPQARSIRTIFGRHCFHAFVYSRGPKQKIELRPIDSRLNLPDSHASYRLQEFTQLFCVEKAFGVGANQFEAIFGQKLSVAVLEDINRDMGTQAETYLDEHLPEPKASEEGELLILTADGKGVPLVKADAERVPAFDKKERPGNRRMATLGCLYSVDRFVRTAEQIVAALFRDTPVEPPKGVRPEPVSKQYRSHFAYQEPGEEPIGGAMLTWSWLASEAAKRHQLGQPIVRLMDGSPTLWDSADAGLAEFVDERREAKKPVTVVDILDILHVSSYVWKAAKVFHTHHEQQEAFAQNRLLAILRGEVKTVIAGLRRRATASALIEADAKVIATVCAYFENNASRMRYDVYLSAGYPIATGVIEGACRHVIKDRMEQGGMRWTLAGAQAMLNLRAIHASDAAEEFGFWRQEEGAKRVHPHRQLVEGYTGFKA